MEISFVILTWNSAQYIERCLDSLLIHLGQRFNSYEIFIVDNGSTDKTQELINKYCEDWPGAITPVFLEKNTGTTYSRNLALKKAAGDFIAVLDSDVIIPSEIFGPLVSVINSSSEIGMVVPRLVYGDGRFQKSTDDFPTLFSKLYRYFWLKRIERNEEFKRNGVCPVDYAISAFWLFKKEVIQKIGYLDEFFFYAPEDIDFCLRVWKAGYKILYVPDVIAVHDAQEISRDFKMNKAMIEHVKGLLYFFRKHRYLFRKPGFVN
jgi:GT2 family glycosyltransferase